MASSAAIEYGTRGPLRVLPASARPGSGPTLLGAQPAGPGKPVTKSVYVRPAPTASVVQARAAPAALQPRATSPQARSLSPPPVSPLKLLSRSPPNPVTPAKFRAEDDRLARGAPRQGSPPPRVLLSSPKGGIRTGPAASPPPVRYRRPALNVHPMLISHHSAVERRGALHASGARLWQRARNELEAMQALNRVVLRTASAGVLPEAPVQVVTSLKM